MIQAPRIRNIVSVLAVMFCSGLQTRSIEPLKFGRLGPSGGTTTVPNGTVIELGVKAPTIKAVFMPHYIRVSACVFAKDNTCAPDDAEIFTPGGPVFDTVNGESSNYSTEVARTLPTTRGVVS